MTNKRIIDLAYTAMLNIWAHEREILNKNPDDLIAQLKEPEYWAELKELEELVKAHE